MHRGSRWHDVQRMLSAHKAAVDAQVARTEVEACLWMQGMMRLCLAS